MWSKKHIVKENLLAVLKEDIVKELLKEPNNFNLNKLGRRQLLDAFAYYPSLQKHVKLSSLNKGDKIRLYVNKPKTYYNLVKDLDIKKGKLDTLLKQSPKTFFEHGWSADLIGLVGWKYLLQHEDPVYDKLFTKHIRNIRNQTEIRRLLRKHFRVVKYFDVDDFNGSVFMVKHFVLLANDKFIRDLYGKTRRKKNAVVINKTVFEDIRQKVMLEILGGSVNRTEPFMRGLDNFEREFVS